MKRWEVINWIARRKNYRKYLEIGSRNYARNLDKIECKDKTGVDLNPRGDRCHFRMTSDAFFEQNTRHYNLIFIDGLHAGEQVAKDIENALAILEPDGTIVMHDCNPPTEWHQREEMGEGEWNGTVWKGYMHYRTRGDLRMCVVDDDWGLGVIRYGKQTPVDTEDFTYAGLNANRKQWLNLLSFNEFKTWFKEGSAQCQMPTP